jgi:hypothetical protein
MMSRWAEVQSGFIVVPRTLKLKIPCPIAHDGRCIAFSISIAIFPERSIAILVSIRR